MNNFQKISVALLLGYAINLGQFAGNLLKLKLPVEEIFWILPCMLLLAQRFGKKIKLPYLLLFVAIEIWILTIEYNLLIPYKVSIPNTKYALGIFKFYTIYIALLTIKPSRENIVYLLKLSIKILIPFISIFYLQYLDLINLSFVQSEEIINRHNVGNLININGISLVASYGVLCILLLLKLNPDISLKNKRFLKILIPYFLTIIFLHASRGAFIIAVLLLIVYYRKLIFKPKNIIYLILGITGFIFLSLYIDLAEDIAIIKRILGKSHANTGRGQQIIATWNNFLKEPFLGLGYDKAGINWKLNTIRSNFHYTQILASYGLVLAGSYFFFLERIFGYNRHNWIAPYSIIFAVIIFASYNWSMILILSFLGYYNYYGKTEAKHIVNDHKPANLTNKLINKHAFKK